MASKAGVTEISDKKTPDKIQSAAADRSVLPARPDAIADPLPKLKELLKEIRRLAVNASDEQTATRFITDYKKADKEVKLQLIKHLFRNRSWDALSSLEDNMYIAGGSETEIDFLIARALIYTGKYEKAYEALTCLIVARPLYFDAYLYAAIAASRMNDFEESVRLGKKALTLKPDNVQCLHELALNLRRLARAYKERGQENDNVLKEAIEYWSALLALDPARAEKIGLEVARSLIELGKHQESLPYLDSYLARNDRSLEALILKSQCLVATNSIQEAIATSEAILAIDPNRQSAKTLIRSMRYLVADPGKEQRVPSLLVVDIQQNEVRLQSFSLESKATDPTRIKPFSLDQSALEELLRVEKEDWIVFAELSAADAVWAALRTVISKTSSLTWCGRIDFISGTELGEIQLWRRDLLSRLAESAILSDFQSVLRELASITGVVAAVSIDAKGNLIQSIQPRQQANDGLVMLMSKHGIIKFGGGEHFLRSMGDHYKEIGFDTLFVGTRPERVGDTGNEAGRPFAFVDETPVALRRFFIHKNPALVHVLSGLGFQVAEALEFLNIPFVYGVHFWRDCLGQAENDMRFFRDLDKDPIPKAAFRYVIERASTVYSNSQFTQAILEEAFGFRSPIIYSLPPDLNLVPRPAATERLPSKDYVLLVNARAEKGFALILQTAKQTPEIQYLVIASQSDRSDADQAVVEAGVRNVIIHDRVDSMDMLYAGAKIVAVPSYQFVETFSRVCIEAQRYGKPVLGSNRGNVPYLLRKSGIVLADSADVWAAELTRLYSNPDYYREACAKSFKNSDFFSYSLQKRSLAGVFSTINEPLLIGIGSGIGNMLHVGPMIANIATKVGHRVDLVVAEDHAQSLFLLHNSEFVNSVFSLRQHVLRRKYRTFFVTHSFGTAHLPFAAENTVYAREWKNFEPAGELHETVYNLESAKNCLNIPYSDEDVLRYFVGDYVYNRPEGGKLIGFHGGSKDGFWSSKRWPYFDQLAKFLVKRGYEVASFGTTEEFIPGTIDKTGGSIEEMVANMLSCSFFVSNDSGLMNLANALGIPVVSLFAPTNPMTRGPLRSTSTALTVDKSCSPCECSREGKEIFQSGRCKCIADLSAAEVEAHVLFRLREEGL